MIPKSFRLMGHTYRVEVVDEKDWLEDDDVGACHHERHLILIRANQDDSAKQHTFCHELVHAILGRMGENELDDDEQFVDVFGALLHQAWTSIPQPKKVK